MAEAPQPWRRRVCGAIAALHAGYVVLVVWFVVWGVTELARQAEAADAATQITLSMSLMIIATPLLIGLAIASPVLIWLVVLAVGLWRGRRWARTGGIVTFVLAGVALLLTGTGGGVDPGSQIFFGVLMPAPSFAGLALLLTGATSFSPRSGRDVEVQSAT